MTLKIISYDLKGNNKDYNGLINAIKEEHGWWHYLDSFWLVKSNKSVEYWTDKLVNYLDDDDNLIVLEVDIKEFNGFLKQSAFDWIKKQLE
jgi:hypothetical protein